MSLRTMLTTDFGSRNNNVSAHAQRQMAKTATILQLLLPDHRNFRRLREIPRRCQNCRRNLGSGRFAHAQ